MPNVSLTTLRARTRELADATGSAFVSDSATSLDAFINAGLSRLFGLIAQWHEWLLQAEFTYVTIGDTPNIVLPADCGSVRLVDFLPAGGNTTSDWRNMEAYHQADRNRLWNTQDHTGYSTRYSLQGISGTGVRLNLAPKITTIGVTIFVAYSRCHVPLVNAGDTVDVPNGWEEYACLSAAIDALNKEESDTSGLAARLAALEESIRSAPRLDSSAPLRIKDAYENSADAPYDFLRARYYSP